ncbi:MAG TPA: hypothetical protein EYH30_11100 [Anaerolineales bacterium]|nr:hypothetical protein [Anaerolineae bacterium]HIQ02644.1 hypothetical protein [Anaerolineales bacterium]
MRIITLTTDFGVSDGYVGVMKGVILSIAPDVRLVDLSHHIPPQDVRQAAYLLYTVVPFFPSDTVHVVVVDPGVGTERRAIALETSRGTFVGPDNGLFTYVLSEVREWRAVELANPAHRPARVSNTFHGRDLFSPAAAHLAAGVPLEELGPPVTDLISLPLPRLEVGSEGVEGELLHADRFGNLITSVGRLQWDGDDLVLSPAFRRESSPPIRFAAAKVRVEMAGRSLAGIRRTYGEAEMGELVPLVGSEGFLEIAVRQGNAQEVLKAQPGDPVRVHL